MQTHSSTRAGEARIEFHRKPGKIHPRAVSGPYDRARWTIAWITQLAFYGGVWLEWNGRQAVLFDIAQRKFHLFGLTLWPQDALLAALALIVAATALFLVTAVAGRLFCGFACPQTVYTAIFRWIEARIEGDHLARRRLEEAPPGARKFVVKTAKHAAWLAVAVWTGITFVGYFTPIRELLPSLAAGAAGPWEGFWVLFYAGFTYLQAGFTREMVCLHMCPYSRFQGVMFDADTRTIAYDAQRGEPRARRGALHHASGGAAAAGQGDCIDCGLCVQVCPTGIDIRDGLQYQCIACGLCVDACDGVMRRIGAPTGLIRMASENEAAKHAPRRPLAARPRVLAYAATLCACILAGGWLLANRSPLIVDVLRDRGALLRELPDGPIENVYTLKLMNLREAPRRFRVAVEGLPGGGIVGADHFDVAAGSVLAVPVTVAILPEPGLGGRRPIRFRVESLDEPPVAAVEPSVLVLP